MGVVREATGVSGPELAGRLLLEGTVKRVERMARAGLGFCCLPHSRPEWMGEIGIGR